MSKSNWYEREKADFERLSQTFGGQMKIHDFTDGKADPADSTVTHHPGFGIIKHRAQSPLSTSRVPVNRGPKVRVSNFKKNTTYSKIF